jgi:hypothetical protein
VFLPFLFRLTEIVLKNEETLSGLPQGNLKSFQNDPEDPKAGKPESLLQQYLHQIGILLL